MIKIIDLIQPLKMICAAAIVSMLCAVNVYAATGTKVSVGQFVPAKNGKLLVLAAVDLPRILPSVMGAGDVFQGYDVVVYKNVKAMRLRIFNQRSGQVRYVFVDMQTGRVL